MKSCADCTFRCNDFWRCWDASLHTQQQCTDIDYVNCIWKSKIPLAYCFFLSQLFFSILVFIVSVHFGFYRFCPVVTGYFAFCFFGNIFLFLAFFALVPHFLLLSFYFASFPLSFIFLYFSTDADLFANAALYLKWFQMIFLTFGRPCI